MLSPPLMLSLIHTHTPWNSLGQKHPPERGLTCCFIAAELNSTPPFGAGFGIIGQSLLFSGSSKRCNFLSLLSCSLGILILRGDRNGAVGTCHLVPQLRMLQSMQAPPARPPLNTGCTQEAPVGPSLTSKGPTPQSLKLKASRK